MNASLFMKRVRPMRVLAGAFFFLALAGWGVPARAVDVSASGCCQPCLAGCCESWACHLTDGQMASTGDVQTLQNAMVDAINTFGKNVSGQTQMQTRTTARDFTSFAQNETLLFRQLLAAWEAARYVAETTGASGTPYQACSAPQTAATFLTARAAAQATQSALSQSQARRNVTPVPTLATFQALAQAAPSDLSATNLFQAENTASSPAPTQASMNAYIGVLTNPLPAQRLQQSLMTRQGAAQRWNVMNKLQLNALSQAQDTLSEIAARQAPPAAGQRSVDGILEADAASRLLDPNWNTWIQQAGQPAMAKDIAKMGALSLAQQQDSLRLIERLAALTAQDYALRLTADPQRVAQPNAANAQARAQTIAN